MADCNRYSSLRSHANAELDKVTSPVAWVFPFDEAKKVSDCGAVTQYYKFISY